MAWLESYAYRDKKGKLPPGLRLQYHSRSDEHSKQLGRFIVDDLLGSCEVLRGQAARGEIVFGLNHAFVWPNGKAKTLDLAIGTPRVPPLPPGDGHIHQVRSQVRERKTPEESLDRLLLACEEKAVMTEHGKSQPRLYSELNDSHVIVHGGSRDTIATAIASVNIAATFVSATRQRPDKAVEITQHIQPHASLQMVEHLRRLPIRERLDGVGLDAYCSFVVDVDNQGHAALHRAYPAPQPGDPDHYDTFLQRISRFYSERYADLAHLPDPEALSIEDALRGVARRQPGLLAAAARLLDTQARPGTEELASILDAVELQENPPAVADQDPL